MKFFFKIRPLLLVFVFSFFLVALPTDLVLAQSPEPSGFVTCNGPDCSLCNLVDMTNTIIDWLFGIFFLIFAVVMFVAGIGLVTSGGNQSALDEAKKKFQNAVIGLLIVMAAWLIVDRIMVGLLADGAGSTTGTGPWNEIECQVQVAPQVGTAPGTTSPGGTTSPSSPGTPAGDATAVRSAFTAAGVGVNNPECPAGMTYQTYRAQNGSGCTGTAGLNQQTVDSITAMRQQCGSRCPNFTITGGSELGHSGGTSPGTHGGGDKFDIGLNSNPNINSYILGSDFTDGYQGTRPARVNTATGAACVYETNPAHWDCRRAM